MQTVYCTTANFIRHTGNVVDLTEYRRRLEGAAVPATDPMMPETPEGMPARTMFRPKRRRYAGTSPALFLDILASTAIVIMAAVVVVKVFSAI